MRTGGHFLGALAVASALTLAPAHAQNNSVNGQSGNSGTSPEGMGSTGWTGGNRGQTSSPGSPDVPAAADSPDKQPPVVTGSNLLGPPKAFPSNKAPE